MVLETPRNALRCPNCARYLGAVSGNKGEEVEFVPCGRCGLQTVVRVTKPLTAAPEDPRVAMETT